MTSPNPGTEFWELIHAICENVATPAQVQQFERIVLADPAACQLYLDYMAVHGGLCLGGNSSAISDSAGQENSAAHILGPAAAAGNSTPVSPAATGPLVVQPGDDSPPGSTAGLWGMPWPQSWPASFSSPRVLGTIVLIGLGGYFASLFLAVAWQRFSQLGDVEIPASELSRPLPPVARLRRAIDCRWEPDSAKVVEGEPLPLEPLRLAEGFADIHFENGALVTLEGPAEFIPKSASRGELVHGRLLARVPRRAVGFTVSTPQADVVDLGTEFGVEVDAGGGSAVRVFKGHVSVQPVADADSPRPRSLLMHAGDSKRISKGMAAGEWIVEDFVPHWQQNELPAGAAAHKHKQVYPDSLIAYWSFDETEGLVRDKFGRTHGVLQGGQRGQGLVGSGAANFAASQPAGHMTARARDWALHEGLTVEALVSSSWSGTAGDEDFIFRKLENLTPTIALVLRNDDRDGAGGPAMVFELLTTRGLESLVVPLDGQAGRPTLAQLADRQTHHVAATYDAPGRQMVLYVDGLPCGSQKPRSGGSLAPNLPASSQSRARFDDPFSGTLDEIAVYDQPLSADQLREHWQHVSHGETYFDSVKP